MAMGAVEAVRYWVCSEDGRGRIYPGWVRETGRVRMGEGAKLPGCRGQVKGGVAWSWQGHADLDMLITQPCGWPETRVGIGIWSSWERLGLEV